MADLLNQDVETIFNYIYQVLTKNGLIDQVVDEEKKMKSFVECKPILQALGQTTTTNYEMNIRKKIEQIVLLLNVNTDDKHLLEEVFGIIGTEISKLKDSVFILEKKVKEQEHKLSLIESTAAMKEFQLTAYDIIRFFRFYCVEPAIKSKYPKLKTWPKFTGKIVLVCTKRLCFVS